MSQQLNNQIKALAKKEGIIKQIEDKMYRLSGEAEQMLKATGISPGEIGVIMGKFDDFIYDWKISADKEI